MFIGIMIRPFETFGRCALISPVVLEKCLISLRIRSRTGCGMTIDTAPANGLNSSLLIWIYPLTICARYLFEPSTYAKGSLTFKSLEQTVYAPCPFISSLKCAVMLLLLTARSFEIVDRYFNDFEKNQAEEGK